RRVARRVPRPSLARARQRAAAALPAPLANPTRSAVVILSAMPTVREQALAPLSRVEAERLLPTLSVGKQTLQRRILRARCLTYVESFDVAWAELTALHAQTKDPLLSARIGGPPPSRLLPRARRRGRAPAE